MVRSGPFELQILYGGDSSSETSGTEFKLEELRQGPDTKECDAIVETDLDVPNASYLMETTECDPFGEEFTQSWTVTPYELKITNSSEKQCWVYIFIDGVKDKGHHLLEVGQSKIVRGFESIDGSVEEFVFSRPRLLKVDETIVEPTEEEKFEIGSIKAQFFSITHEETTEKWKGGQKKSGSDFESKHKKTAAKAGAGTTSRAGKTLVSAKKQREKKGGGMQIVRILHHEVSQDAFCKISVICFMFTINSTHTLYNQKHPTSVIRIRYAMKDALIKQGVVRVASDVKEEGYLKALEEDDDSDSVIDLC